MMHTRKYAAALLALVLLLVTGCEDSTRPNVPPTVRIVEGAMDGEVGAALATFAWVGSDPDGIVDHYLYAIETLEELRARRRGEGAPLVWSRIDASSGTFQVPATTPDPETPYLTRDLTAFHLKAVDDDGAESTEDVAVFDAENVAPSAGVELPGLYTAPANACEVVTVRWTGRDFDAPAGGGPLGYQVKLIQVPEAAFYGLTLYPEERVVSWFIEDDSLRTNLLVPPEAIEEGALAATDWYPRVDDLYTERSLELPIMKGFFFFAVRAWDVAGAVSPPEYYNTFRVRLGPSEVAGIDMSEIGAGYEDEIVLRVFDEGFFGSRELTGGDEWRVTVPSGQPIDIGWESLFGDGCDGSEIEYDFALDIPDPGCDLCHSTDGIGGWIGWGPHTSFGQSIVFRDDQADEQHVLWVRARDIQGRVPPVRIAVRMDVVTGATFERPALLVDDFVSPEIDDCSHDAFVEALVGDAIAPYLRPGETLDVIAGHAPGASPCAESPDPVDIPFTELLRYRTIFWAHAGDGSVLGTGTTGAPGAMEQRLRAYVNLGGRVVLWGTRTLEALTGRASGRVLDPYDETGGYAFRPGSFLWDVMALRTRLAEVSGTAGAEVTPACDGIVGLEATPDAFLEGFPIGTEDPTGHDPDRFALWIDGWSGTGNPMGLEGTAAAIGPPELRTSSLDTVYTYVTNAWAHGESAGDVCDGADASRLERKPVMTRHVIGIRDESFPPNVIQGQVIWIGAPLHAFAGNHAADLTQMMSRIAGWVMR